MWMLCFSWAEKKGKLKPCPADNLCILHTFYSVVIKNLLRRQSKMFIISFGPYFLVKRWKSEKSFSLSQLLVTEIIHTTVMRTSSGSMPSECRSFFLLNWVRSWIRHSLSCIFCMWFMENCIYGITASSGSLRVHSHYSFTDIDLDLEKMRI